MRPPTTGRRCDLFVIRHGIAEERSAERPDGERALTEDGRARLRTAVAGLETLGIRFDQLWHSPLVRAVQTAEMLRPLADAPPRPTESLAREPTQGLVEALGDHERIALVGHEPWLGELVAWLATGDRLLGDAFSIKKGAVIWLRGVPRPGGMVLRAAMPPRILRAIGEPATA